MHLKKDLSKLVNFCVAILILKMEEKKQHFWPIMLYFKKGKNATEMQKKICAMYGEGAATDQTCQSGLQSFLPEISRWTMLHGRVDQLKVIAIKSRHSLRTINVIPCGR